MKVFLLQNQSLKNDMVREKGGTLIVVPCWWDGSNERYGFIACLLDYNLNILQVWQQVFIFKDLICKWK